MQFLSCFKLLMLMMAVLICAGGLAAEMPDLSKASPWTIFYQNEPKGSITAAPAENVIGSVPGILVKGKPGKEKSNYASIDYSFKVPVSLAGLKAITFFARSDKQIPLKMTLNCEGGNYRWNWTDKQMTSNSPSKYRFELNNDTTIKDKPDLGRVKSIGFQFGLYATDTTNDGFEIGLGNFVFENSDDTFVIPPPQKGISIDGYYKDWGHEDALYNWTPPDFIQLNSATQVVQDKTLWEGPESLSARISFMIDDKNLYFLALVIDADPFKGGKPETPWENDSVELFLGFNVTDSSIRQGHTMNKDGIQIVFDCGTAAQNGTPGVIVSGKTGRELASKIERRIVKETFLVNGRQSPGYALEAAIPLDILPIGKLTKGAMIAYSAKVNDFNGAKLSLTPSNSSPHMNMAGFKKAYIEFVSDERSAVKFGKVAANPYWPKRYDEGLARPRIWEPTSSVTRGDGPVKKTFLNGFWAMQPVDGPSDAPKTGEWTYMPLPAELGYYTPMFKPEPKNPADELGTEIRMLTIYGYEGQGKSFYWFERTFVPAKPKEAEGKVLLRFDYLRKEADVYLNEKYIGFVNVGNNMLDVTEALRYGEANRLDLRLQRDQICMTHPTIYNGKSISGDIYLEYHSAVPLISDVWVKNASGLDGSLEIQVETRQTDGAVIEARVLNGSGRELLTLPKYSGGGTAALSGRCEQFTPWSLESPVLHILVVRVVKDGKVLDEKRQRFGFRTFEIKNARFMLNGKIVRFRSAIPSAVMNPDELKEMKRAGFNFLYTHSDESGNWEPVFNKLDECGMLALAPTDPGWPDEFTAAEVRKYRSHPSVIGYVSDHYGLLNVDGLIQTPFSVDDSYYPDSAAAVSELARLRKRAELFRKVDSTRPYIPHSTGNFDGAFRNLNRYATYGYTLQDRSMFFVPWRDRPNPMLPYFLIEYGVFPLLTMDSLHPDDKCVIENWKEKPRRVIYEQSSRYLGQAVFDDWRPWMTLLMRSHFRGARIAGVDGYTPWDDEFAAQSLEDAGRKDNRKLSREYFTRPFAEVIEDGYMRVPASVFLNNGNKVRWQWPEKYGIGPVNRKLPPWHSIHENENQPLFVGIGGSPNPFAMDRNYFTGEKLEKTIIAANDTESDVNVPVTVTLSIKGCPDRVVKQTLKVPQGKVVEEKIIFELPPVEKKTNGLIQLRAIDNKGAVRNDSLEVAIFPKTVEKSWVDAKIGYVAAPGVKSLTEKMGISAKAVSLRNGFDGLDLLIIEQKAMTADFTVDKLRSFLDAGGKALILEQNSDGFLGWRLQERRLERLFAADKSHPVLKGLDDADFSWLRGFPETVPSEHRPSKYFRNIQASSGVDLPHVSSEGMVASCVMAKPAYGSFHPILVGGFDLAETALLEFRTGKGMAMLCQVDVTARYGVDPAATLLLDNLVEYMLALKPRAADTAYYSGGHKGKAMLDRLGVVYSPAASGVIPDGATLIMGEGADSALAAKTGANGRIIVLPVSEYLPKEIMAKMLKIRVKDYPGGVGHWEGLFLNFKSECPGADRLGGDIPGPFKGLVDQDLYFFENPEMKTYDVKAGGKAAWRSKYGLLLQLTGVNGSNVILCGVNPELMKGGECRGKAWRVWSTIFANLGVECSFQPTFTVSQLDLSGGVWQFVTDPNGSGEKKGFAEGEFGDAKPIPIRLDKIWEEQGVTAVNPNVKSPPDSAYDGFGWYVRKFQFPANLPAGKLYFGIQGLYDFITYSRNTNKTCLWINGVKQPPPVFIANAKFGGSGGARVWKIDPSILREGRENVIAVQVYNEVGPGGIYMPPVRFEAEGRNDDMIFPYEFYIEKFNQYYNWSW